MGVAKHWRVLPLAGGAVALAQILYAAHRPDLPSYDNYDPSAVLGDPGLPGFTVAAVGDSSITAPGVRHVDDAWIRRVAHALTDRYFVNLVSFAVGGSKASDVLADQLDPAVRLVPDLVILSVAANDAIRAVPAGKFEEQLEHIVGTLCATGAQVVVVGVGDLGSIPRLPRFLRKYLTMRSAQFDRISAEVAARHPTAFKVDVRGDLSEAFWQDPLMFSGDGFHASSHGHEHFAHHVYQAVAEAIG